MTRNLRKRRVPNILLVAVAVVVGMAAYAPASSSTEEVAAPIFGIKIPPGYRDWKLISVAHEEGSLNDLRAIVMRLDTTIRLSPGSFGER
jgi:hypothetical protein